MKRSFLTIDCETDPFRHRRLPEPFVWGIYDGAFFTKLDTTEQLVNYLCKKPVLAYAHNGGKFDFHFLLEYINLYDRLSVINGRLVSAKIGECELRDSWNILPVPLATYMKTEIDYRIFEKPQRAKPENYERIVLYLKDDCVFLHNLITDFETSMGRHLTMASACMASWKDISGRKPPNSTKEYFYKFSPWYYGGRVQCFRKGVLEGPYQVVDIRSAYPKAMCSEQPYGLDYVENVDPSDYSDTSLVSVIARSSGALPWRDERGIMRFPADHEERLFHVTGHELRAGLATGTVNVIDFLKCYDWPEKISFKPYIDYHFALKEEGRSTGNKGIYTVHKHAMTDLYGKFGSNPDNYGNYIAVPFDELEQASTDGYEFDGILGPHALLRAPLEEQQENYFNVATASSITGQVRAKLWRAICGSEDTVYCDTDCIVARQANVDLGTDLGQWELEGTAERAYIGGKKLYLLEGDFGIDKATGKRKRHKRASKGVQLPPSKLKKVAAGETVLWKSPAPTYSILRRPDRIKSFQRRKVRMTA